MPRIYTEEELGISAPQDERSQLVDQLIAARREKPAGLWQGYKGYTEDIAKSLEPAVRRGFALSEASRGLIDSGDFDYFGKQMAEVEKRGEQSAAMQHFNEAKGLVDTMTRFAEDPVSVGVEGTVESLAALLPTLARRAPARVAVGAGFGAGLGAAGGPTSPITAPAGALIGAGGGLAEATGRSSYDLEYAGKFADELRKAGVDPTSGDAIRSAFAKNPRLLIDIHKKANLKAIPIAVVDTVAAMLGGKVVTQPAKTVIKKAGQAGAEVALQSALGAGGEYWGQKMSGEETSWPSVVMEAVAEPFGSAPSTAVEIVRKRADQTSPGRAYLDEEAKRETGITGRDLQMPPPEPAEREFTFASGKREKIGPRITLKTAEETAAAPTTEVPVVDLSPGMVPESQVQEIAQRLKYGSLDIRVLDVDGKPAFGTERLIGAFRGKDKADIVKVLRGLGVVASEASQPKETDALQKREAAAPAVAETPAVGAPVVGQVRSAQAPAAAGTQAPQAAAQPPLEQRIEARVEIPATDLLGRDDLADALIASGWGVDFNRGMWTPPKPAPPAKPAASATPAAPAPTQEAKPSTPDWVVDMQKQAAAIADRLGVRQQIIDLAKQGRTAREIVDALGMNVRFDDAMTIVRSVRNLAGLPDASEMSATPATPPIPTSPAIPQQPSAAPLGLVSTPAPAPAPPVSGAAPAATAPQAAPAAVQAQPAPPNVTQVVPQQAPAQAVEAKPSRVLTAAEQAESHPSFAPMMATVEPVISGQPAMMQSERNRVRAFLGFVLKTYPQVKSWDDVTVPMLDAWSRSLPKTLSANSRNAYRATLSRQLPKLASVEKPGGGLHERIAGVVTLAQPKGHGLAPETSIKKRGARGRRFDDEAILALMPDYNTTDPAEIRMGAIVGLMASTGARPEDIAKLLTSQIDLQAGAIKNAVFGKTETGKPFSTLSDAAIFWLNRYITQVRTQYKDSPYLFPGEKQLEKYSEGSRHQAEKRRVLYEQLTGIPWPKAFDSAAPMTAKSLQSAFKIYAEKRSVVLADGKAPQLYKFRHTLSTFLKRLGIPNEIINLEIIPHGGGDILDAHYAEYPGQETINDPKRNGAVRLMPYNQQFLKDVEAGLVPKPENFPPVEPRRARYSERKATPPEKQRVRLTPAQKKSDVTPSETKPEKPPQTITGSNVQTGTEMPVQPEVTAKAGGAQPKSLAEGMNRAADWLAANNPAKNPNVNLALDPISAILLPAGMSVAERVLRSSTLQSVAERVQEAINAALEEMRRIFPAQQRYYPGLKYDEEALRKQLEPLVQEAARRGVAETNLGTPSDETIAKEQAQQVDFAGDNLLQRASAEGETAEKANALDPNPNPLFKTLVRGVYETVAGRASLTPEARERGRAYAAGVFIKSGVEVVYNPTTGLFELSPLWRVTPADAETAGRTLLKNITEALKALHTHQDDYTQGDYLGTLLDSVVLNLTPNRVSQFSSALRDDLFALAQGERSLRGIMLAALRGMDNSIEYVARNIDRVLTAVVTKAFGQDDLRTAMQAVSEEFLKVLSSVVTFTDAELKEIAGRLPVLEALFMQKIALRQRDVGGRVYRSVQRWRLGGSERSKAALEEDAKTREAVADIVEKLSKLGIKPEPRKAASMSALEQLLFLVDNERDPKAQDQIRKAVEDAVAQGEFNAGKKRALARIEAEAKAVPGATLESVTAALNDAQENFGTWDDPNPEFITDDDIELGLEDPEYAHWKLIRDNLTKYNPVTVSLVRNTIRQFFRGTQFPTERQAKVDERDIDFNELAVRPDEEVEKKLKIWFADMESKMTISRATPETRRAIMDTLRAEVSDQLGKARERYTQQFLKPPPDPSQKPPKEEAARKAVYARLFERSELLSPDPQVRERAVAAIASKSAFRKLTPPLKELIQDVLKTPAYRRQDMEDAFIDRLSQELGVPPSQLDAPRDVFRRTFRQKWSQAAEIAKGRARTKLFPAAERDREAIKSRQGAWAKVVQFMNAHDNAHEAAEVLWAEAEKQRWWKPSERDLERIRRLGELLDRLTQVTPSQMREIDREIETLRAGGELPARLAERRDILLQRARDRVTAVNSDKRTAVKKEIETFWSQVTRPINLTSLRGWQNTADALLEIGAANMLATPGFVGRQGIDIFTQGMLHTPLRAFAHAVMAHREALERGEPSDFLKTLVDLTRQSYQARHAALTPRLTAVAYTLKTGSNDLRNIERIQSSIGAFPRLDAYIAELQQRGDHALAYALQVAALTKFSYYFAGAMDNFHGIPAEYQEMRLDLVRRLREEGRTLEQAAQQAALVFKDAKEQWRITLEDAALILAETPRVAGKEPTEADIKSAAEKLMRMRLYHGLADAGLPVDEFTEKNRLFRNVIGWNETEPWNSVGGVFAGATRFLRRSLVNFGIPAPSTNFGNAIGISINKIANQSIPFVTLTDLGQRFLFGVSEKALRERGVSDTGSPFWRTPEDRLQRKAEAAIGNAVGIPIMLMVAMGVFMYRDRWPKDKREREEWEKLGYRPRTLYVPTADGKHTAQIGTTTGLLMPLAPWLAAGAAIRELIDTRAEKQKRLDEQADKLGIPRTQLPPPSFSELVSVPASAMLAGITGGRTAAGAIGNVSDYQNFSLKKALASQVAPFVPYMPFLRQASRLFGNRVDTRMASFTDLVTGIPTSGSMHTNMLGDPVGSGPALQRVLGEITGNGLPWVTGDPHDALSHPYRVLFESEYRPPSINPSQGRLINGQYRPLTMMELARYTRIRGEAFKQELQYVPTGATETQVHDAFNRANTRAMLEMGIQPTRRSSFRISGPPVVAAPPRRAAAPKVRGGFKTYRSKFSIGRLKLSKPKRLSSARLRLRRPTLRGLTLRRPRLSLAV